MGSRNVTLQCWKCGTVLHNLLLPFSRYEECSTCNADLHSCLCCKHYAANLADSCREDRAEFVLEKDKANFCDFFRVNPKAYNKPDDAAAKEAKARLAELFGDETEPSRPEADSPVAEADKALTELKRLFGDDEQ
ncbi:MAG: hypothetical protein WDZ52_05935 [Pseudohongiellaceae bacterium]